MKVLYLFLLFLITPSLWAQQTVQLHIVCGEPKADCIGMKTVDGKDMLVQQQPEMEWASGDVAEISAANNGHDQKIFLTLSNDAAKKFADLTRANLHRQLAIIANGKIIIAPTINQPIVRGPLQIQIAAGANLSESPLLSIPWVKDRLIAEKRETASALKAKSTIYVAFGLFLLVGALYFVFRKKEQPTS
jgi:hypothetical protein